MDNGYRKVVSYRRFPASMARLLGDELFSVPVQERRAAVGSQEELVVVVELSFLPAFLFVAGDLVRRVDRAMKRLLVVFPSPLEFAAVALAACELLPAMFHPATGFLSFPCRCFLEGGLEFSPLHSVANHLLEDL